MKKNTGFRKPRAVVVAEQTGRPDTNIFHAGVVDLRVRLDAAAREARGRDAGGVDVGPLPAVAVAAASGVVGDEVDGLPHHGVAGAAAAARRALRDDEDAVRGELRQEGRLA